MSLSETFHTEQARFERWFEEEFTRNKLIRQQTLGGSLSCEYKDPRVNLAFKAWLARAKI